MNESGQAVRPLVRRFGIEDDLGKLVVVHDELDLPPGRLKVKVGGGLAGNNGLRSIRDHLHTTEFLRVRIGVGKPPSKERGADHVLARPASAESLELDDRRAGGRRRRRGDPGRGGRAGDGTASTPVRDEQHVPPRRTSLGAALDSGGDPPLAPRAAARDEPVLADVLGATTTTLTVPGGGPGHLRRRLGRDLHAATRSWWPRRPAPKPNAWPTTCGPSCGEDGVDVFPAWETLPFERVSPAVETMGRRLRTMWRLTDPDAGPPRSWSPPSGPWSSASALTSRTSTPSIIRAGAQVDQEGLVSRWSHLGYRREYQVEHRGEVAVRGSIVDVFPSTADAPVRIDLWGDEVDRLTEFSVADQRSTTERTEVQLFACRELLPTEDVRERAAALLASEPWGREQWERLAEGLTFDGMESWLPWLAGEERLLADLLAGQRPHAPGRARPHARPGGRPAGRGDRPGHHAGPDLGGRGPGLPAAPPRLRPPAGPHRRPRLVASRPCPRVRTSPEVEASAWDPVIGDGARAGQATARASWPTTTGS